MTPGGGGAAPGATPGPAGGGGAAITFVRQRTAKDLLKIRWDHPVFVHPDDRKARATGETIAKRLREALPRDKAMGEIRGKDLRPLLIVRECGECKGTDDALLSRTLSNEKTLLMARWFHCVKLPKNVLASDHPFRNTFDEKDPTHLFLASWDGKTVIPMSGVYTQRDLWDAMNSILGNAYERDPEQALDEWRRILDESDTIDSMQALYEDQYDAEIERKGPKSRKLKKILKRLDEVKERRDQLDVRRVKVTDLGLKRAKKAAAELVQLKEC